MRGSASNEPYARLSRCEVSCEVQLQMSPLRTPRRGHKHVLSEVSDVLCGPRRDQSSLGDLKAAYARDEGSSVVLGEIKVA